jgi:hypothetical protein
VESTSLDCQNRPSSIPGFRGNPLPEIDRWKWTRSQSVAEGLTNILTGQGPAVTVPAMAPPSWPGMPAKVLGGRGRRDRAGCRLRRHRAMPVRCKPLCLLSHFGTVGLLRTTVPLRQGISLFCDVSINSARGMHFAHADASARAVRAWFRKSVLVYRARVVPGLRPTVLSRAPLGSLGRRSPYDKGAPGLQ